MFLEVKDFPIDAGGRLQLNMPAEFFQIMEAVSPVDIDFLKQGARVGRAAGVGQGFRIGPSAGAFDTVIVTSAAAQTLKLCFANGPVDLSQVVSVTGTVSVINGEIQRVLDGAAFVAAGEFTSGAGQYPYVELWNPAGSGKNLVLTNAQPISGAAMVVNARISQTALTGAIVPGKAKKLDGPAGVGEIRSGQNASAGAVLFGPTLGYISMDAGFMVRKMEWSEPLVIPPAYGLVLCPNVVATYFGSSFEWLEQAI